MYRRSLHVNWIGFIRLHRGVDVHWFRSWTYSCHLLPCRTGENLAFGPAAPYGNRLLANVLHTLRDGKRATWLSSEMYIARFLFICGPPNWTSPSVFHRGAEFHSQSRLSHYLAQYLHSPMDPSSIGIACTKVL